MLEILRCLFVYARLYVPHQVLYSLFSMYSVFRGPVKSDTVQVKYTFFNEKKNRLFLS